MNIVFIKEDDTKGKSLRESIKKLYNKLIGKIETVHIINDSYKNIAINRIILQIPDYSFKKLDKRFIRKLIYKLRQNATKNIVLSENLLTKDNLKNELNSYNYNILDERSLIKNSCIEILEYVMQQSESNIQEEEVAILVNDNSNTNMELITNIANLSKSTRLATNNTSKFKKLEKELYEQKGILLSVGNNKKKWISKSKYIINIDFPEELLTKYKIYKKAIIINLENKVKIDAKSFSGILINDIQMSYNQTEEEKAIFEKFDLKQTYLSKLIAIDSTTDINNIKIKDKFKITNTIGNNGIINNNEYKLIKNLY